MDTTLMICFQLNNFLISLRRGNWDILGITILFRAPPDEVSGAL